MIKKTVIALFLLLGLISAFFFVQDSPTLKKATEISETKLQGEQLYKTNCGICHNGASAEAPKLESLKLLSQGAIISALQTGVMRNQAATLSKEDHQLLAEYISEIKNTTPEANIIKGLCEAQVNTSTELETVQLSNWGFDLANTRFVNHRDLSINAKNVSQLKLAWTFAFPQASRARVQPTIAGNTIYTASQHGTVYALDRATACIRWTFQADAEIRSAITIGTDENGKATRLYFGDFNATVYALDLSSKSLLWKRRIDEHPLATITGSLNLYNERLYIPVSSTEVSSAANPNYVCCTFRGSVVSLDAITGDVIWKSYTIPVAPSHQGLNANGNPIFAPSGAPVWTSPTIDTQRAMLYVGTGENYTRPTSTTSDAIIAMSLKDGEIKWVRQTVPKDAWNGSCMIPGSPNCPENHGPDYDFGAPPILVANNTGPDLILAGQKSGMVYALDPDRNGAIVWKKRVGRGGMMGGVHWGMASDGSTLYVPINDHDVYPEDADKPGFPGLHALDLSNGKKKWSTIEKNRCGNVDWVCDSGISAAISLTPELVFGGALDGVLKAYSAKNGKELWAYDTNRIFDSVNDVKAFGGTIDSDGPVIVGHQLFINSGYAKFGEKAGNVLLAFEL